MYVFITSIYIAVTQGTTPSPRFGHSCILHKNSNSLIFTGGSNGTDLIRNGEELYEV
jgi:hypothetical protein